MFFFLHFSGTLSLSLKGISLPTDGTGRVRITDINPNGDNNEDALICQGPNIDTNGDFFLHPSQLSTDCTDRIQSTDPRGWLRNRAIINNNQQRLLRLRRDSNRAVEGVVTCEFVYNATVQEGPVSIGVYYPSEFWATVTPY